MSEILPLLTSFMDRSPTEYLNRSKMLENGTWTTEAEIVATANYLGYDIYTYTKYGNVMEWMNHPASFSLQNITEFALYIDHVNGNHYNVVMSVKKKVGFFILVE